MPVIQSVREHLNVASVTVIASAATARLSAGRSVVDQWLCPETLGLYRLFCRDVELGNALGSILREARYVLNFLGGSDHIAHRRLIELTSAEVVSVDPRPSEATRAARIHITHQWTQHIRRAGWEIDNPRPAGIKIDRRPKAIIPRVLIHPGSGGRDKCWPMERWLQLVELLHGTDVTWMLGPAEANQARALQDRSESILFEPDLDKATAQMATYDLYVGNDSGMTHLAAAIGLPTVAVFGTTDPHLWRPLGEHVHIISPEEPQECMESITESQVIAAVGEQLNTLGFQSP